MTQTQQCAAGDHEGCPGETVTIRSTNSVMVPNPKKPGKMIKKSIPEQNEGPNDHVPCGCAHHAPAPKPHLLKDKTAVVCADGRKGILKSHDKYAPNSASWVCTVNFLDDDGKVTGTWRGCEKLLTKQ